jgi:hypothetical protein
MQSLTVLNALLHAPANTDDCPCGFSGWWCKRRPRRSAGSEPRAGGSSGQGTGTLTASSAVRSRWVAH